MYSPETFSARSSVAVTSSGFIVGHSFKGSRWYLAALLTPELPKLFDIHGCNASKPCVEIDGGRRFSRLPFHG